MGRREGGKDVQLGLRDRAAQKLCGPIDPPIRSYPKNGLS